MMMVVMVVLLVVLRCGTSPDTNETVVSRTLQTVYFFALWYVVFKCIIFGNLCPSLMSLYLSVNCLFLK